MLFILVIIHFYLRYIHRKIFIDVFNFLFIFRSKWLIIWPYKNLQNRIFYINIQKKLRVIEIYDCSKVKNIYDCFKESIAHYSFMYQDIYVTWLKKKKQYDMLTIFFIIKLNGLNNHGYGFNNKNSHTYLENLRMMIDSYQKYWVIQIDLFTAKDHQWK